MPSELLTIGDLAARTGRATSALRYYEDLGLLKPRRRVSGQRRYGPEAVAAVAVIVFLRDVGFTLTEVKRMVASRARSPRAWQELARRKLDELDTQIAKAQAARVAIAHSLSCPKDDIVECPKFWKTVNAVVAGSPIEEAHAHRQFDR
jgi:DNA-binding transcriptional MerR regulator